MKKSLLTLLLCVYTLASTWGAPQDAQWQKVDEAVQKGLPKSAIEALEPIIKNALAEKQYGEAVKAIARKIVLEGNIQGNKPEEKITRLEKQIEAAPAEIKPLLQTLLAHWYWHYFQQNRWRFMQRTATAEAPGPDFTTWDLPRLFAEIDKHFTKALAAEDLLKTTPVTEFDELLEKGTMPDSYRPTLYDFIAHEALQFYTSGEQATARPQDDFQVTAATAFAPVDKFIAADFKASAEQQQSAQLKALRLYQALLRFHSDDKDKTAFINADIERLLFGKNVAIGENKTPAFKEAMSRVAQKWSDHELAATANYHIASAIRDDGNLVEAHAFAKRAAEKQPNTVGAQLCLNLAAQIESKSASITTERVWNQPLPKISVRYKNVTEVFFRAVRFDWNEFVEDKKRLPEYLNDEERRDLLKRQPVFTWSQSLPATTNFQERVEEFPAPKDLMPGSYYIIASYRADFAEPDNQISIADVWVSDLAFIVRSRAGWLEGFVLEANSGEPIKGAQVDGWYHDYQHNRVVPILPLSTDENGFFQIKPEQHRNYIFRARHKNQELGSKQEFASYWRPHEPGPQTVLFTDRALYRPGQTIQYKGICLQVDQSADNYKVIAGQEVMVRLVDVNGKELAQQKHRCNDYGSFTGSFTAPRDVVMGQMTIQVPSPPGSASFNVEEYKRPKFLVTLDAPSVAPKLNDKVTLTGHAMAYTGAAVDGAQVKYRIVREVRMPWWWWYRGYGWHSRGNGQSQEIANGTLKTEVDGSFKIEFAAKPDPAVPAKDEPTFVFQVFADVTDNAGETRSDQRTVNVGYTALQAQMSAGEWQVEDSPVEITVLTRTLDGEPQSAEGVIKVYELRAPQKVHRPSLIGQFAPNGEEGGDLSSPNNWPLGRVVSEKGFLTDKEGKAKVKFNLKPGAFRAILETQDRFGKKVTGLLPIQVLSPESKRLGIKIPHLFVQRTNTFQPGDKFFGVWGTGYEKGRAYVEIEHRNQIIQRYWTKPGRTQQTITVPVTEAMRGGFTIHVTQVRENRAYITSRHIEVPWTNKELDIKWEHFTSKLQPGQKETWTAVISGGKEAEHAVAEMVATLYDKSLDAFLPHQWMQRFQVFRRDYSSAQPQFQNMPESFQAYWNDWRLQHGAPAVTYRQFPHDLTQNVWYYGYFARGGVARKMSAAQPEALFAADMTMEAPASAAAPVGQSRFAGNFSKSEVTKDKRLEEKKAPLGVPPPAPDVDLEQVSARKNLNETAFFFPQLTSDSNGVVRMTFTMPEALTEWRFMGFAHDQQVRSGFIEGSVVTAKDLMVQPNPPRFLREGDEVEFTVKVSNQSETPQRGKVRLTFNDGLMDKPVDALLGNKTTEQTFEIPARQSRSFHWRIKVPDGLSVLTYKAVGAAEKVSDGEEGFIPVLSRRILVTESLPLPIRGPAEKEFRFKKLLESGKSDTLKHQSYTVQMVSNPSWYAVMALPYLMEFPYECSEQTFNRLYANALARHIAKSDPKIHRIFEQWRGTPALDSPLQKNEELKSVLLQETPWVRQAEDESQARKNVGILFDDNRLDHETEKTFRALAEMQHDDGAWPWFPGGPGNDYITLYITTGFGRMRHLDVKIDTAPAVRSLNRLDNWINDIYREILSKKLQDNNNLSPTIALYLYGRSFFLKDKPIAKPHREAVDYFLSQARKYWLDLGYRQSQGHLAIALKRFNEFNDTRDSTPVDIMKSIKERSVTDEELGMFWRDMELSWWWYRAPIETQALMIEAFDEVMSDEKSVEECKVWLLKQKQTQDWKTTKATADAVYALMLRGENLLASDALVEMKIGGQEIKPEKVEAGTGFYEKRFSGAEVKPSFGEITVTKVDKGVAWGSAHWQYFEDMTKVTPHEGTPLKLKKTLFKKVNTSRGPELQPIKGALEVGDELVVRIELRTDRDMEYVHMKDQRGSGTEPVNVLSRYKYQDGLAYYESTRDTASHFFIDYLPKGVYVFEYSSRVQLRGEYQSGIAEIQCMYAPEFNSHSESYTLSVK